MSSLLSVLDDDAPRVPAGERVIGLCDLPNGGVATVFAVSDAQPGGHDRTALEGPRLRPRRADSLGRPGCIRRRPAGRADRLYAVRPAPFRGRARHRATHLGAPGMTAARVTGQRTRRRLRRRPRGSPWSATPTAARRRSSICSPGAGRRSRIIPASRSNGRRGASPPHPAESSGSSTFPAATASPRRAPTRRSRGRSAGAASTASRSPICSSASRTPRTCACTCGSSSKFRGSAGRWCSR